MTAGAKMITITMMIGDMTTATTVGTTIGMAAGFVPVITVDAVPAIVVDAMIATIATVPNL